MKKIKIWTVAADDREGTRATVHLSEREAYEQWLEWRFSFEDADEMADRDQAMSFIENEDFRGLWEWEDTIHLGDPLSTYAIEEHEIEVQFD